MISAGWQTNLNDLSCGRFLCACSGSYRVSFFLAGNLPLVFCLVHPQIWVANALYRVCKNNFVKPFRPLLASLETALRNNLVDTKRGPCRLGYLRRIGASKVSPTSSNFSCSLSRLTLTNEFQCFGIMYFFGVFILTAWTHGQAVCPLALSISALTI